MPKTAKKSSPKNNLSVSVMDLSGKTSGDIDLTSIYHPKELADGFNHTFIHQILLSYLNNHRQATAKCKTRAEVSGGGKKPWKQKGTGRARHGSTRSPLWRHGGVAFGPTGEQNFSVKINKTAGKKAIRFALLELVKNNQIFVISGFSKDIASTKKCREMIDKFNPKAKTLVALDKESLSYSLFLDNLDTVTVKPDYQINALDIFKAGSILCTKAALENIIKRVTH